jgi:signal transduction histidine kinase
MDLRRDDRKGGTAAEELLARRRGVHPVPYHTQLVGRRLYVNAQVRFVIAAGIVCGALAGRHLLGITDLDTRGLAVLALLLAAWNTLVFAFARRHRNLERRKTVNRPLMAAMHVTICVDFIFLTAALWFAGGAKSPFQAFYIIHVVLAAALLSPPAAAAHAAFGYTLFAGLVLCDWTGFLPARYPVGVVNCATPLDGRYALTILAVQAVLMVLAVALVSSLTRLLRRGEHELHTTNAELDRLSKFYRDFLHIALHDLKAPVGAATMLIDTMEMGPGPVLAAPHKERLTRVRVRLQEALAFLHDFSVLGMLDADGMARQADAIDVGALVSEVVEENMDALVAKGHRVSVEIAEDLPPFHGIERLIHEAVANLVTNAGKYTPEGGSIAVRAFAKPGIIRIEVEDNGIGIAPEDQKHLFGEFVRIRRLDSPVGQVAGSGLGLSIVRRIIEACGGQVGVISERDQGSTFYIELPVTASGE